MVKIGCGGDRQRDTQPNAAHHEFGGSLGQADGGINPQRKGIMGRNQSHGAAHPGDGGSFAFGRHIPQYGKGGNCRGGNEQECFQSDAIDPQPAAQRVQQMVCQPEQQFQQGQAAHQHDGDPARNHKRFQNRLCAGQQGDAGEIFYGAHHQTQDGQVQDDYRIDYLARHIRAMMDAVDMRAYGLMDGKAVIEMVKKTLGD